MAILICYDSSESAQQAVLATAATSSGRPAILLHVWSPPDRVLADSFGTPVEPDHPSFAGLERLSKERAEQVVRAGRAWAEQCGLSTEGITRRNESSVWQTILDTADELEAEAIVVGTRGTTAAQSQLLGSVSNAVIHHAHRPVLVVPADASDSRRQALKEVEHG